MEETTTKEEIFKKFLEFLKSSNGPNGLIDLHQIKINSRLADVGLSSHIIDGGMLILVDAIHELEEHFNIEIDEEEIFSFLHVSDIIDKVFVKIAMAA